ncbi:MAG: SLC13 family permease [Desulfobacterales bacterium]|nr:SLC13 family permease [Desulfobacterales bacterium]
MNFDALIVLMILGMTGVMFVSGRIRGDLVAVIVMLLLMIFGIITLEEAFEGFSSPAVIVIAAMFIVGDSLVSTGITKKIGFQVLAFGKGRETRLVFAMMLAVGIIGAFMSSTAAMAIFIPITLYVCEEAKLDKRRLLMPLSCAGLISGMMTLVATTPNLIISDMLVEEGLDPLAFFSVTPFGVVILIVAIGFMLLIGRYLLGSKPDGDQVKEQVSIDDLVGRYGLLERLARLFVPPESDFAHRPLNSIPDTKPIIFLGYERRRGKDKGIYQVASGTVFKPGDDILVLGDKSDLNKIVESFSLTAIPLRPSQTRNDFLKSVGTAEIMLTPRSILIGHSLEEICFRERYNASVIAIGRRDQTFQKDLKNFPLDFGDTLLLSGSWETLIQIGKEKEDFILLTFPKEYDDRSPSESKAPFALVTITLMVIAMASGILPNATAALFAALVLIFTKSVDVATIYRTVNWQTIILIAGIIPLGTALEKTGIAQMISTEMIELFGAFGPLAMLAALFLITAGIGLFLSNTPTAVLVAPIALEAASQMNVSPHAFAMTVAIACSAAFITPVSSPVNLLTQQAGGYSFMDFVKVGLPLFGLTMSVTLFMVNLIYL